MSDWQDMDEFQGVDLNDSFVLSWNLRDGDLVFDIEASLWPGHSKYEVPPKTDWTCYKRATLIFPDIERVEGLRSMSEVPHSTDPDGTIDFGNIDVLAQNNAGSYLVCGDFANVAIRSARLVINRNVKSVSGPILSVRVQFPL